MYQLLFRSRWFALAWVLMMAASAAMFATTGAGTLMTATSSQSGANEAASDGQSKFRSWAEDDNRRPVGQPEFDPSRPDQLRDEDSHDSKYETAPYSGSDSASSDDDSANDDNSDANSDRGTNK